MFPRFSILVFLLTLNITLPLATAQTGAPTNESDEDNGGTRHHATSWGNPLADGPLRALMIAPRSSWHDVVKLEEHLEMEIESVALWDRENMGYDPRFPQPDSPEASRESVIEQLEQALKRKKLDLIILAQADPNILTEALQQKIMDRVNKGTGLLLTNYGMRNSPVAHWFEELPAANTEALLLHGVGPLGIERNFEDAILSCRTTETGRVAHVTFPNAPAENHSLIPVPNNPYYMRPEYAENSFSLLAKTALWSSRRDSPFQIIKVEDVSPRGPDDEEIPPGYPPEFIEAVRKNAFSQALRPYALHLDSPAPETMDIWFRLRLIDAPSPATIHTSNVPLRKGDTLYPLDIVGSPGTYWLDVWAKTRKGIVTWYTQEIVVPGWPTLSNVVVERSGEPATWILPNDELVVKADVDGGAFFSRSMEGTVFTRVRDSFGRQIASQSLVVGSGGGPIALPLEVADVLAPLLMVEVFAVPDVFTTEAALLEGAYREVFYLPVRMSDPLLEPTVIVTDGERPDFGTYNELEILRKRFGVSVYHAPLSIDSLLLAGRVGLRKLTQLPTTEVIHGNLGADALRVPCLSSDENQKTMHATIQSGLLQSYAGGPPCYSLGAGNAITHTEAELCQSEACLDQFQTRLKAQYSVLGDLNQSWGTTFPSWDDVTPMTLEECRSKNMFLPWLRFRLSMNEVFTNFLLQGRDQIRQVDPFARVGFQPLPSPAKPQAGHQWDLICAGMDYVVVPDAPEAVRRLKSFHDPHAWDGVAIDASHFEGTPEQARHFAWRLALEQLPAIWLDNPASGTRKPLMDATGAVLEPFAAFGDVRREIDHGLGTLLLAAAPYTNEIAILDTPENDLLRSVLPDHGESQVRSENWFADVLNTLGFAPRVFSMLPALNQDISTLNTLILADTHVLTETQQAAIVDFHKSGGLIIASRLPRLLNNTKQADAPRALPFLHPTVRESNTPELWCNRPVWIRRIGATETPEQQIGALLHEAGNIPIPAIKTADSQRTELNHYYFAYGAAVLQAVLPKESITRPLKRATLPVPEAHVAYDLRSTETIAFRNRVQWSPTPGEAQIIATLPYRVTDLTLVIPASIEAGNRLPVEVILETDNEEVGSHLIALRVEHADGTELIHYRQTLRTDAGRAQTFFPLAQNERSERYVVVATDLLSGTVAQAYVTID